MCYATITSHSGVSGENKQMLGNKGLLSVCLSLFYSAIYCLCSKMSDCMWLARGGRTCHSESAPNICSQALGWVGKHLTTCTSSGEPLSAFFSGRTDSCHAKRLCHTCKTMREVPTPGSNIDKCSRVCWITSPDKHPGYVWVSGYSKLSKWCNDLSAEQHRGGSTTTQRTAFSPYLIHPDKRRLQLDQADSHDCKQR